MDGLLERGRAAGSTIFAGGVCCDVRTVAAAATLTVQMLEKN